MSKVTTTNQPKKEFEADKAEIESLRRLGILHSVDGKLEQEGGENIEEESGETQVETNDSPKSKNRHRAGNVENQESPGSVTPEGENKS